MSVFVLFPTLFHIYSPQFADFDLAKGIGAGMDPPQYLTPGTKMEVWISKIGTLRNLVEFA
jgi:hypothetical protein